MNKLISGWYVVGSIVGMWLVGVQFVVGNAVVKAVIRQLTRYSMWSVRYIDDVAGKWSAKSFRMVCTVYV